MTCGFGSVKDNFSFRLTIYICYVFVIHTIMNYWFGSVKGNNIVL